MQHDTAWRVVQTAFKCGADLQALLKFIKENCSAEEYRSFAAGIASAVDALNVQLTDRALAARPELAKKIESELAQFGRIT